MPTERGRFHLYMSAGKWWCKRTIGTKPFESWGDTPEQAFVKWLLYWGTKSERAEYSVQINRQRGILWYQVGGNEYLRKLLSKTENE